jgi:vitamin B12 transporter
MSRQFAFPCILAVSSCTPFVPIGACVAAETSPGAGQEKGLERVVVTANRIEQPLSKTGNSMTVLDAEEIRASQKLIASDLLARTPGVTFSRNGGVGGTTGLRIRGAEADQTVVLLDGVKLNDPSSTGGGFNFANLLLGDLMRIEVLRGPQSTLWGSQAIGGVVNIVTPVPDGPLSGAVTAEGGARGSASVQARAEAGGERLAWRVASKYFTTDGISAFDEDLGGVERDSYRNSGVTARGIMRLTDSVSAEVRSTWSKGRTQFDGFRPALTDTNEYGDTEEIVTYAGIDAAAFGGRSQNRFGFAYTDTDRQNFDPDSSVPLTFDARGRNERWEYHGTLSINERNDAVFGLESERSELKTASPSEFDPNPLPLQRSARLDSAYAQLSTSPIDTLTLTAGLRYDDHEAFGAETTGRAAVAWVAAEATTLRASYGEGFKAPTLFQLFSEFGNEFLEPERAEAWDVGIEQRLFDRALVLSGTYFSARTSNMIDFVSCFGGSDPRCPARPFGFYDNVQKTRVDGFELGLAAQIGERVAVTANYTNMDAQNDVAGDANSGRDLVCRPGETFNANLSYSWPFGLTTTIAVQHSGRSFDNAANTIRLDSYTIVDLLAALDIRENLELFARLENAFDEDYATTAKYGSIGRGAFVGLRQAF